MAVSTDPAAKPRQRRRPATRKGRPTLTRDVIAQAMLDLAGQHGFRAVTMRLLAEHLGVTVRALYNYVDDRQEIVDRAVWLFMDQWPVPKLDPEYWQRSLADYCAALRAVYRRYPRALLVSLDEQISDPAVHPNRLLQIEALLAMLRTVGLSLTDALAVHHDLSMRVFAFVLLVDHRADQGHPVMTNAPVPQAWLSAHPDLTLPHLREAADTPPTTVDEAFDGVVDSLVRTVQHLASAG